MQLLLGGERSCGILCAWTQQTSVLFIRVFLNHSCLLRGRVVLICQPVRVLVVAEGTQNTAIVGATTENALSVARVRQELLQVT